MSQQYDNRLSGVLFKNERKEKDSQPSMTGKLTDENGKEWRLAAWTKEGRKGKFLSLKLSEPQSQQQSEPAPQQQEAPGPDPWDEEIPY